MTVKSASSLLPTRNKILLSSGYFSNGTANGLILNSTIPSDFIIISPNKAVPLYKGLTSISANCSAIALISNGLFGRT